MQLFFLSFFSPSITVNLSLATLYLLLPLFQDLLSVMTSTGLLLSIIRSIIHLSVSFVVNSQHSDL